MLRSTAHRDVLHLIDGLPPEKTGGTQTQLMALARAQRAAGYRNAIVTLAPSEGSEENPCGSGDVPILRLAAVARESGTFRRVYQRPELDGPFREVLRSVRPGCLHVHHLGELSFSLVRVAAEEAVPVVLWLSDFWLQCLRGQRFHDLGAVHHA